MKHMRKLALLTILLCGALVVAACGSSASVGGGGSTGGSSTASPTTAASTATTKPKPSTPPKITAAFCQSVMTVAQANQIMHPTTPATTIYVQSDSELGVCRYDPLQAQLAVVKILVEEKAYTGPKPVPTSTIVQYISELENAKGATVSTTAPVSGVGDQAEFLAASVTASGATFYVDVFYVIYGNVAFLCDDFHLNTKPDDTAQQNSLRQCAERVVSQL